MAERETFANSWSRDIEISHFGQIASFPSCWTIKISNIFGDAWPRAFSRCRFKYGGPGDEVVSRQFNTWFTIRFVPSLLCTSIMRYFERVWNARLIVCSCTVTVDTADTSIWRLHEERMPCQHEILAGLFSLQTGDYLGFCFVKKDQYIFWREFS